MEQPITEDTFKLQESLTQQWCDQGCRVRSGELVFTRMFADGRWQCVETLCYQCGQHTQGGKAPVWRYRA